MTSSELLIEAFDRIPAQVHDVVEGLTPAQLTFRLDSEANSIAWLVWHMSRIADDHIAEVAHKPQVWTSSGWATRWRLPFAPADTGYGHTAKQVAAVTGDAELLLGYFGAVNEMTTRFVPTLTDSALDRIVDKNWDPPVTLGVRLVSVAGHNFEQVAQAAFIRGVLERNAHH
ncbi:MAG: DinB family protein [Chloroflexi bacterium]|nr:MAG: DinB family protein [Chloroflexota bacterium]